MGSRRAGGSGNRGQKEDKRRLMMPETCSATRGAGNNRAFEDAANARIQGELQEVESDLPEDIRDDALRVFRSAIADKCTIQDAINKENKEALCEVEERFKGQRFKGFIKFDYDTNVIQINVNKFGNGNAQFSVGMGVKKMVSPDPFMGKLSDPNMNR